MKAMLKLVGLFSFLARWIKKGWVLRLMMR